MYADWTNHIFQIIRYSSAFILFMILWPKLMFWRIGGDLLERLTARFTLMALTLIVLGYILVAAKIFEVLAIFPILCILTARTAVWELIKAKKRNVDSSSMAAKFFDWLEGKYNPWPDLRQMIIQKWKNVIDEISKRLFRAHTLMETLLLLLVFSVSGYIRFYDAFVNAAPAMSDSYVTLAWIKYIDQRILFYDGIYPQGFHIWMDYLAKFAVIDSLYILKYTGPLNALLLMLGMYLAVSRWTDSRAAGILTAGVYGLLGSLIGGIERQAATNSQEFGLVFIIPVLFFIHHWLRNRIRWALITGIAGMTLVGLIHSLAYVFLGLGVLILIVIYIPLTYRERFRPIWPIIWGGIASIVISSTPLALGLLFGKKFHSTSGEFAVGRNFVTSLPTLHLMDWISLIAIAGILLWIIWHYRRIREFTGLLFVVLLCSMAFSIYYFSNLFTFPGSKVIASRATEFWSIVIPVGIGTAMGIFFRMLQGLSRNRYVQPLIATALIIASLILVPPKPIIPYKMEWNSSVEQYLKIKESFLPKSWTLVSHAEEGHGLVLGSGFPIDTSKFLNQYDPSKFPLTKYGESEPDGKLSKDIFIYYQKDIYRVDESNSIYSLMEPLYAKRVEEMERLEKWIKLHREVNPTLSIWYEDKVLKIYHIHQPTTKEEELEKIWGKGVES